MMVGSPVLIDTGPSERGFHRLEAVMRCPLLYAYKRTGALGGGSSAPLVRGTLAHVGLAQLYARLQAAQNGLDPETFMEPGLAMAIVSKRYGALGEEMLGVALPLVRAYADRYTDDSFRVLEIEVEHRTRFWSSPTQSYLYTARLDLVVEDQAGKVWVYDHKCVSEVRDKTFARYALSGQFFGQRILARQAWGDRFAGVRLNVLGIGNRFVREDVPPAPWMEARYPEVVVAAERRIAEIEAGLARGEFPGASTSEMTCVTPYGLCDAFELCRWGPEVIEEEEQSTE